jgi:hypothetical protein
MKKVIKLTESDLAMIVKRVIKENDDFTKEIAKDLFKRLPKNELTMSDFLTYMKEKGAPESIYREVIRHLEMMNFPFKMEAQREPEFTYDNDDSEEYEMMSDDPSDWYFDIYLTKYPGDYWDRTLVTLNIDPDYVDTEVGSHNVPANILEILNECGFDPNDTEDGHWYLKSGFNDLTKQELIDCLTSKGLNHTDLDM